MFVNGHHIGGSDGQCSNFPAALMSVRNMLVPVTNFSNLSRCTLQIQKLLFQTDNFRNFLVRVSRSDDHCRSLVLSKTCEMSNMRCSLWEEWNLTLFRNMNSVAAHARIFFLSGSVVTKIHVLDCMIFSSAYTFICCACFYYCLCS